MNLLESLEKVERLYPKKIGVICGDDRFTYGQFVERIRRLAEALQKRGIGRGDRMAVLHQNCHYFLEAYYALALLGAISCPLNYRLSAREIAFILKDTEAKALIAQPRFSELVSDSLEMLGKGMEVYWTEEEGLPEGGISVEAMMADVKGDVVVADIDEDDVAQLYYTSGTTGRQKGVMLTHKNVAVHALGTIAELKLTDEDRWIHVAPMFHLADAWATWAITWVGGTHIMVPEFDPKKVMELMEKERVTLTNMIPTMLNLMVNDPSIKNHDFSSLRVMLSGGAPIAPEVVRKIMEAFGLRVRLHPDLWHDGDGAVSYFFHPQGLPEGAFRGGAVSLQGGHGPARHLRSAQGDPEGYVNIVDRKKDMIVTGGENVYSTEVENVLYEHPAVLEAAVIGIPDEKWGEAVHACVVLKEGMAATEREIIEFCKQNLARYKAPKSVEFLSALPRTGSGKIYKKGLRDKYLK